MDKSEISLDRMRSFVRVAERGSLSAVARELGIGQSSVSRHVQELEDALGVALFARTTRRVALTEEGARYYAHCLQILRLVERAHEEMQATAEAPAGVVRLSCTAAFGTRQLSPLIFAFQDRHPDIDIDLSLTDERINLVQEGVDLALRLGPLSDSSTKLRSLGNSRRLLVAAPSYLARYGRPRTPADLAGHQGIRMTNIAGSDRLVLSGPGGQRFEVPFGGRFRVDHGLAAREALAAGRGLGPAHRWLVDDLLADGRLESIMPDYAVASVPLSLLIRPERASIARVRLLIDYLTAEIARIPGIEPS